MAKITLDPDLPNDRYGFRCPGCKQPHQIPTTGSNAWGWNKSVDKPTFTPSILVRFPQGRGRADLVCHSFVTDGRIQFLGDCFHELKGQTVELADI
jgi:Family of unknown function (DUF6527)